MALRATMDDLIAQARLKINDPAAGTPVFSDLQVQDALDQTRQVYNYLPLLPVASYTQNGATVNYLTFYAVEYSGTNYLSWGEADPDDRIGYWEKDAVVQDQNYNVLTTSAVDYFVGKWTFAATKIPPVLLIGAAYDLYGACAELLEDWAATKKLKVDFMEDRQSVTASQFFTNMLTLARHYRTKARARNISLVRTDIGYAGGGNW